MIVDEPARLLEFLRRKLPDWKRSTLEQRIRAGSVSVNGATVRRNDLLTAGDEVAVAGLAEAVPSTAALAGMSILHDDEELIAVNKPAGLLSVSTDRETERTALALLREHLSRRGRPVKLWPVHRIDRETSGVLLFAKSSEARERVQAQWEHARKVYLALVEGRPAQLEGVIDQPLWEDRALFVRVGHHPEAKEARTRYVVRESNATRSLLEIELDTGRRHQIRAHLAWLGHPIVGDPRYGNSAARMGLHALRLIVPHPSDGQLLSIEAPPPKGLRLER